MEILKGYNYKEHPANKGRNYTFCETISEEVLRNYLSRAVTLANECGEAVKESDEEYIRFILNIGAKYVGRLTVPWVVTTDELKEHIGQKKFIEKLHSYDPEIICEACIFENITPDLNEIAIPAWVFERFGLKAEKRNFSYDSMLFENGAHVGRSCGGRGSCPDITRIETQLWFYWRACNFIDLGYESLHMGQVNMISENDKNLECFTKVFDMIREYAKQHSRRKMILINGHTFGMYNYRGELMYDFHAWPLRCTEPEGSVPHKPDEYPQEMIFGLNDWPDNNWRAGIYHRSKGGKTPSGWNCENLPYLVELDNAGPPRPEKQDIPDFTFGANWGYDDISWFANQTDEYRQNWLKYAADWVKNEDVDGNLQMPGRRMAFVYYNREQTTRYYAGRDAFGDEETIREILISNK